MNFFCVQQFPHPTYYIIITYHIFNGEKIIDFTLRTDLVLKTILWFLEKLRFWSYCLVAIDCSLYNSIWVVARFKV